MEIGKQRKFTVNSFLVVGIGLVLLMGAVIVYLFVLRGVIGRFSVNEVTQVVSRDLGVKQIFEKSEHRYALLYSQYTENMLEPGNTWIIDNVNTWKKFLDQYKLNYTLISDRDIEDGKLPEFDILIMPGARALSDEQIAHIKKFIDLGGSIYSTSGTASYSADGKWRGWDFFSEVFGVKFVRDMRIEDQKKIHTLRGGLPLTSGIPTGYPLKIATWDRPIAVEVLEPRTTQVSFWYNYRLDSGLVRDEVRKSAGIVYGTYGKGRFVWMGFEINSVIGQQEDFIYFDKLFSNSIKWLSYQPIAVMKDWPGNYKSAAIFVSSLGKEFQNVRNLLPILRAEGVKSVFFMEPDIAERNSDLVRTLGNFGEVGATIDIGYLDSVNDTINQLYDFQTQKDRIYAGKNEIRLITNKVINGIYPFYGLFDENTLHAITELGIKYIITDSLTDRSVPRTIIKGDKSVISITKTARDDYEVIRDFGLTEHEFQLYTYKEDIDRVIFEGGLYVSKLHSEFQLRPENVAVVRELIRYMKSKNIWITDPTTLYYYWTQKNKIELHTEMRGFNRIAVTITNLSAEIFPQAQVDIEMQTKVKNIEINREIIGTEIPKWSYDPAKNTVIFKLTDLRPGQTRIYYIDFDRVAS